MKFTWVVSLIGIVIFFFSLIAHFPVQLAWKWRSIPLQGEGISGTLWQGNIDRLLWKDWVFTDVQWQWSPKSLLQGQWRYHVSLKSPSIKAQGSGGIGLDLQGGFAKDWQVFANAAGIASQIPAPMPIQAQGTVTLLVDDYRYARPFCQSLVADGQWQNSELNLPLGDLFLNEIRADFSCQSGSLSGVFTQTSDSLESQWNGRLAPKGQYSWQGWMKPMPALSMSWRQALSWVGKRDDEGRYQVDLKGSLP